VIPRTVPHTIAQLRRDALAIWQAGVDAVHPNRLVPAAMSIEGEVLRIGGDSLPLGGVERIVVVGGGKAGAAMAVALENALGEVACRDKQLAGWVNVPADAMEPRPRWIHLHPARPAGVNEPTAVGVEGTEQILRMVAGLGPRDLCLCLISGGGSALLPAPAAGVLLEDKIALTQRLSAAGANIRQLNMVRKHLSRIKGGRLAVACAAGRLVSLILSDVIGDPLDLIASGPTVPDDSTASDALLVLESLNLRRLDLAPTAIAHLERAERGEDDVQPPARCQVTNLLIGTLTVAVEAAGQEAARRGYRPRTRVASKLEGSAESVGRDLASELIALRTSENRALAPGDGPSAGTAVCECLISGGEPTVQLAEEAIRGRGGRNQQLALAAGEVFWGKSADCCILLSGGTDGEDGPTDAAGAFVDLPLMTAAQQRGLSATDHLARNDAYSFFAPLGGLIRTGPTQTNVGDLRVGLVQIKLGERSV